MILMKPLNFPRLPGFPPLRRDKSPLRRNCRQPAFAHPWDHSR